MFQSGKSSKKILIVIVDFANGGIESFLYNLLSHIETNNLKIDIAFNRKYSNDTFLERITPYVNKTFCYGGCLCYSPFFYLPRLFWRMKTHAPYDILYANAGLFNGFIVFFGYLLHIRNRISHLHAQESPVKKIQQLKKQICSILIRIFATKHLAPSSVVFQCFTPPFYPRQVIVNGIDTQIFQFNPFARQELRRQLRIQNELLIGHIGRFDKVKNHLFLLDIFKQIHTIFPQSKLLLVGSGKQEICLKQHIKALQLDKHIILLTDVDRISPYYQAMDAFVFPSFREGLGIVAIEAQCTGLPCFISDGVPKETMICNTIRLPLSKPALEWAKIILEKTKVFHRENCAKRVKEAGYDIQDIARRIQKEICEE